MLKAMKENLEDLVIREFGDEWSRFGFLDKRDKSILHEQAQLYLSPAREFLGSSKEKLIIADFGAGSGRWSEFLLPYASRLIVVEPSEGAFTNLQTRFKDKGNVTLLKQKIDECEIQEGSLDLAVSLGVIHHLKNPLSALTTINSKLKSGGLLLCYLYYNFENKSQLYRVIWHLSNVLRYIVSKLPKQLKFLTCDAIALLVYLPLSRIAKQLKLLGFNVESLPLHQYAELPLRVLRNDALDRFGTRLESRFSQADIRLMLEEAGFNKESISFSKEEPYWTFVANKS